MTVTIISQDLSAIETSLKRSKVTTSRSLESYSSTKRPLRPSRIAEDKRQLWLRSGIQSPRLSRKAQYHRQWTRLSRLWWSRDNSPWARLIAVVSYTCPLQTMSLNMQLSKKSPHLVTLHPSMPNLDESSVMSSITRHMRRKTSRISSTSCSSSQSQAWQ